MSLLHSRFLVVTDMQISFVNNHYTDGEDFTKLLRVGVRGGHMSPAWASFILPSLAGAPAGWCPEWCATWTCDGSAWCLNGEQPQPCIDCPTGMEPGWSQDWLQDGGASALAKDGKLAAQEFSLHWRAYPGTNCWWGGNGAESEIEEPRGSAAPTIHSLTECKAACLAAFPACGGLLYLPSEDKCFRKGQITISECHGDAELELHVLQRPSPPSPPLPPPLPPHRPVGRGVDALNEQFRNGRPSGRLEEVHMHACAHAGARRAAASMGRARGMHMHTHAYAHAHACMHVRTQVGVLLHQWDGLEEWGTPWQMCITNCMCQGAFINGRISSMIVYKDLSKRPDRVGVCCIRVHTGACICMWISSMIVYKGLSKRPDRVGMCCICVHTCAATGVHTGACAPSAPLSRHMHVRVYAQVGVCAYVRTCLHVHIQRWVYVHTCADAYMYICTGGYPSAIRQSRRLHHPPILRYGRLSIRHRRRHLPSR